MSRAVTMLILAQITTQTQWTIPMIVGTLVGVLGIVGYFVAVMFFLSRWSHYIKNLKEEQDKLKLSFREFSLESKAEIKSLRAEMRDDFAKVSEKLDRMGVRWEEIVRLNQVVEHVKDRVRRLEDKG